MDSHKVILILAAGSRVGAAIASKFASNGYKVALASRSMTDGISSKGFLHIKADLSDTASVPKIFKAVEDVFGYPNIVVYNGRRSLNFLGECFLRADMRQVQIVYSHPRMTHSLHPSIQSKPAGK